MESKGLWNINLFLTLKYILFLIILEDEPSIFSMGCRCYKYTNCSKIHFVAINILIIKISDKIKPALYFLTFGDAW